MDKSRLRSSLGWLCALAASAGACTTDGGATDRTAIDLVDEELPVLCASCELLEQTQAGGETSEFSGGMPLCPIGESTERALSEPELADMLTWLEGRREVTFGWSPNFITSEVNGYAEHTQLVLDVHAMAARDVMMPGCYREGVLLVDIAVDLATLDDSLRGTFTQTVRLAQGLDKFETNLLQGDWPVYSLQRFRGTLDLGVALMPSPAGSVHIELTFEPRGVRGRVTPYVSSTSGADWAPLSGQFPDDGCGPSWPVGTELPLSSLSGETLASVFENVRASWSGALPATWNKPAEISRETELHVEVGEVDRACAAQLESGIFALHAPLRLSTTDGELDVTRSAIFSMRASSAESSETRVTYVTPFVRAAEFAALPGMGNPAPLRGTYAAPEIHLFSDGADYVEGNFHVETWPPNSTPNSEVRWLNW